VTAPKNWGAEPVTTFRLAPCAPPSTRKTAMTAPSTSESSAPRVLLVTGGSRGIGAATALRAARDGWDVAVNYTRDAAAAQAVAEGVRALGRRALVVQADVADEAQVLAMFAAVDAGLGRLTGLVNNAGVVDMPQRVEDMTVARLQRMWAINLTGSFVCAREAVARMSRRHGGHGGAIVNLSSAAARLGAPGQYVDYAASKGAIDSFTIGLAKELATEGVRVNAVRPGIIDTDIHASGGLPDRVAQMAPLVPMQRGGSAEEVAAAIVWLLSDEASYVTGTALDVTGGR
jgi:NAD(P)-dependent dehydrogenase (short-subunit alcohol dehydrogenase family)